MTRKRGAMAIRRYVRRWIHKHSPALARRAKFLKRCKGGPLTLERPIP